MSLHDAMTVTNNTNITRYGRRVEGCREIAHFIHNHLVKHAFASKMEFMKNVLELLALHVYMFKIVELNAHNILG